MVWSRNQDRKDELEPWLHCYGVMTMAKTRESSEDRIDQDPGEGEVKVARGKALPRSEADFSILSEVRDRDIRDARSDWKARTDPEFGGLIEATLEPEEG